MILGLRVLCALVLVAVFWAIAERSEVNRLFPIGKAPARLWLLGFGAAFLVRAPCALLAVVAALVAATVDARTGHIPDPLTLAAAVGAFILRSTSTREGEALAGAVLCAAPLLGLVLVTRRRGFGFGDVKLGAVIGLALGPLPGTIALAAAFVGGGAYGSWWLASRRARRGDAVPFGPFLALGVAVSAIRFAGAFP